MNIVELILEIQLHTIETEIEFKAIDFPKS